MRRLGAADQGSQSRRAASCHDELRWPPDLGAGFADGPIHRRGCSVASPLLHRRPRRAPEKCGSSAFGATLRPPANTTRAIQQARDHERRRRDNRATQMPPVGIDQVDSHCRPDGDRTHRPPGKSLVGSDHRQQAIDAEAPGVDVADGHPARSPPCADPFRRRRPSQSRAGGQSIAHVIRGNIRHQDAVDVPARADDTARKIQYPPARIVRRLRLPQPLALEQGPLDPTVADIDQQSVHSTALTVTSPEMNRLTP